MIVIGITGSIGMGKSTIAQQFEELGAKVFCADKAVHELLAHDEQTILEVIKHFPEAEEANGLNRKALGAIVFSDDTKRALLEQLLHPAVQEKEQQFISKNKAMGTKVSVLDIPLLFETESDRRCDITVVVTAPKFVQEQRVLSRPGMTKQQFEAINYSQMPDDEKKMRADYVIETGLGKAHSFKQVEEIMKALHGT